MLTLLWPAYISYTADTRLSLTARSTRLTLPGRPGVNLASRLGLEDGSGCWLFEDGAAILQQYHTLQLPARSTSLTLPVR
jgi:hypothetical protein